MFASEHLGLKANETLGVDRHKSFQRTLRGIAGESKLVTLAGARKLKIWNAAFRDRGFAKTFYLLEEMTEELRLTEKTAYKS